MLREEGIVVGLEGAYALVSNQRKRTCGNCHAEASCATLSGGLGKKAVKFRALNPIQAEIGERVVLEITESHFLRASFLVYGTPILSMVLVGSLARAWALSWGGVDSESVGAVAGLLAMVLSFYGLYHYNGHIQDDASQQPVIRRVVSGSMTPRNHADTCSVH